MFAVNNLKKYLFCICLVLPFGVYSGTVTLNISGLEDLGANARYEGWLVVGGSPVTTGVFSVNGLGNLSQTMFNVSDNDADNASTFILTIEPFPDLDSAPADSHLLAGDINAGSAQVRVGHPAAIGDDLTGSTGGFYLVNPTGSKGSSFENGIWYVASLLFPSTTGLDLPTLPIGWVYEGWVIDEDLNVPISIGTFSDGNGPDSDGAGPDAGPFAPYLFPGQDYINPSRDLSINHTAVISIEPVPDNSPAPFTLKPLLLPIADSNNSQLMNNNALATSPFGQVNVNGGGNPPSVQAVPVIGDLGIILLYLLSILIAYLKFRKTQNF